LKIDANSILDLIQSAPVLNVPMLAVLKL